MRRELRRRPIYAIAEPDRWTCVITVENSTSAEKDNLFDRCCELAFDMFDTRADVSGLPAAEYERRRDDARSSRDVTEPDPAGEVTD